MAVEGGAGTAGFGSLLRTLGYAAVDHPLRIRSSVPRGLRAFRSGFEPQEARELGLLDPRMPAEALDRYASKRSLMRAQRALNPREWSVAVRNKHLFHRRCLAEELPVPELFGLCVTARRTAATWVWVPVGRKLRGPIEWREFVDHWLPEEFVVKPVLGYHGESVRVLRTSGDRLVDLGSGRSEGVEALRRSLDAAPFDAFLFQARLENHPALASLSDTDSLQTVRFMTLVRADGTSEILHAVLKLVVKGNATDNFRSGRSGNLLAGLDLESGTLGPASTISSNRRGLTLTRHHPDTGIDLVGRRVPLWTESANLARRAARAFLPLRTIGWDVGITPSGPRLVEGNVWWDPPNPVGEMGRVLRVLRREGNAREVEASEDRGPVAPLHARPTEGR